MSEPRQHPDLFTADEALRYLHLDPAEAERTLENLREKYNLVGQRIGKGFMYHRSALDAVVDRIFGVADLRRAKR